MKTAFTKLLACCECLSAVELGTIEKEERGEIIEGELVCTRCGKAYPIKAGIPVFLSAEDRKSHAAESFGFEWQMHHDGAFETNTVFGHTVEEDVENFFEGLSITPEQIRNRLIIDAGCGSGTLTAEIARRYPNATVVGLDLNPAIREIQRKNRDLQNLHLVQASVFRPPFKNETFDFVWSNGVIHHTGNTEAAFTAIARTTKKGGRAYFWVYQKKFSPMVALRILLVPFRVTHWNHNILYRFCQLISIPTWLFVKTLSVFVRKRVSKKHPHLRIYTRKRGYRELVLTWFDVLSPKYRDTYTQQELASWFMKCGFHELTYYWWPTGIAGTRKPN